VRAIGEAISGLSRRESRDADLSSGSPEFPIDVAVADSIHRLRGHALLLYDTESSLRWAGKGASIVSQSGRLPAPSADAALKRQVRVWDRRVASDRGDFLAKAGLYGGQLSSADVSAAHMPLVGTSAADGHYGLMTVDLSRLSLLGDTKLVVDLRWNRSLIDLVALAWSTFLCDDIKAQIDRLGNVFALNGYRWVAPDHLASDLEKAIWFMEKSGLGGVLPSDVQVGNAREVQGRLTSMVAEVWPPMRPVIRPAGNESVIVDLEALTYALQRSLDRPPLSGGADVNVWSGHFERNVQAGIDATLWRPAPGMAAMVGRTLRRGGQDITDIDAVGERNETLLIVSCKAIPFSDAWDRGEYNVVRNIASKVDEAIATWERVVLGFRRNPVGDNYDFSSYRSILGVVVLPHVPWTPSRGALREVRSGLPVAVAASELTHWCERPR
jgi:hypothetical protein